MVTDIIFVYSTFRKAELNSIFENIDNKMFDSKETISIANHLMDIFNQNDIPFKVRTSWPYVWYTVGVLKALKLSLLTEMVGMIFKQPIDFLGAIHSIRKY